MCPHLPSHGQILATHIQAPGSHCGSPLTLSNGMSITTHSIPAALLAAISICITSYLAKKPGTLNSLEMQNLSVHLSRLLHNPSTFQSSHSMSTPCSTALTSQPHMLQVAASQTLPTISQTSAGSLPARVCHCDDNTEDVPPPKFICTHFGPRHSIEVCICHYIVCCMLILACIHAHLLSS